MSVLETRIYNGKSIIDLVQNGRYVTPTRFTVKAIHKELEAEQRDNITTDYTVYPNNMALVVGRTYYDSTVPALFVVTSAGTTGSNAPTWDTTIGAFTIDNTVTWKCITENACAASIYIYGIPIYNENKLDTDHTLISSQRLNLPSIAGQECTTVMDLNCGVGKFEAIQVKIDHEGIDGKVYLRHILTEEMDFKGSSKVKESKLNAE